jgi:ABC-2 type transport system ATP-binding protein
MLACPAEMKEREKCRIEVFALSLLQSRRKVDPLTRREFWLHINAMIELGVTVMVTTHFLDEAEYCDRIGLVYRGRLIAEGSPDELKDRAYSDGRPEPTLEDAFIALVEASQRQENEP